MSKAESVTPPPDNSNPASPSPTEPQNNGHGIYSKSRNARAQARHRAKRKAYIEQLEESVTMLQSTLAAQECSAAGLSTYRMVELEKENAALRQEILHLRNQIADLTRVTPQSHQQGSQHFPNDDSTSLHDSKRRKRSIEEYLGADPSVTLSGRDGNIINPGGFRDDARSGHSITSPMCSPGPRPQLQLCVPQGGYSPEGSYTPNSGHHFSGTNTMAYTSYHAQKSLDPSVNSYQNVTSPPAYDYRQPSSSASSAPYSLLPSPISANSQGNSPDLWSNACTTSGGIGSGHQYQLAPIPTLNNPLHYSTSPPSGHWSTRSHVRSPYIANAS
ncbi:uncharacterized protein EI90DRAFT_3044663 [Cantharellus anzutake]|uniref:uncharacterized protein n=1 Tax=Cantharellus anzutake TaxID=1750568 RepID=UPI001907BB73|nr:uncharacterized protein EI90DRAFT_3044663 [Cantharellus anzutake]KAF8337039.1 hypothetical protein EI90DRAFT_3044663 [Cantharellus anzutake]